MRWLAAILVFGLSGCALVPEGMRPAPQQQEAEGAPLDAMAPLDAPVPVAGAQTEEELDTTTEAQRVAAAAVPAAAGRLLGSTVASLGTVGEPGFWLKTPLVTAQSPGRVVYPATGKSAQVTLIPIEGPATAGSRMSLSAMRLIEAPLTGLTEVEVFSDT
jgi:hypothetical protein